MRILLSTAGGLLLGWLATAPARAQAPAADSSRATRFKLVEVLPIFPAQEAADSARSSAARVVHFLQSDLHFPPAALRDGVQGRVVLGFTVDAQGRTTDLRIVQGLRADVDAEVLRDAQRLTAVPWRPGTQQGRAVAVKFTVPISFSVSSGGYAAGADSLDLPQFNKMKLPTELWNVAKPPPAGRGLIYGTCLQRMDGSSGGVAQVVRLVNLSTGKVFRIYVKPTMRSRRENDFCYALPAGRYALSQYEFNHSRVWLDFRAERLRKPRPTAAPGVAATRYVFTLLPGQLHYVGTWNFANENEPIFLNEKDLLDPVLQAEYPAAALPAARLAIPR